MAGASCGDGLSENIHSAEPNGGQEQEETFLLQRNIAGQNKNSVWSGCGSGHTPIVSAAAPAAPF